MDNLCVKLTQYFVEAIACFMCFTQTNTSPLMSSEPQFNSAVFYLKRIGQIGPSVYFEDKKSVLAFFEVLSDTYLYIANFFACHQVFVAKALSLFDSLCL